MTAKTMFFAKGALSNGVITTMEVPLGVFRENSDLLWFKPPGWQLSDSFKVGRDLFHDEAAARDYVEEQRLKKLRSLQKQIDKLENMSVVVR